MLDRAKLLKELSSVRHELFSDQSAAYECAFEMWQQICADPMIAHKARTIKSPWIMPTWLGQLGDTFTITPTSNYAILSVDGSQIYPDRHQAVRCFLINIGSIYIRYTQNASIALSSEPSVCSMQEEFGLDGASEIVDGLREERELRAGLQQGMLRRAEATDPLLVLFDGSLIFWHLDAKDEATRERFLASYLSILADFERAALPMASYISFPKSKELINLVRLGLCDFKPEGNTAYQVVDQLVDAHIASHFLLPGQRTIIFQNHSSITEHYPASLKPYFFYLNAGTEVARVELPAWLALDDKAVELVSGIILDQVIKGRGYPVTLAEAHEQAVVKGPDREFFYHAVQKLGIEQQHRYLISRKSLNKRSIGI
jgi:hypothetical protein